ncbi:hypoxia inducible factor 1 subunit alpha, like [Austrofundulus limnaeus]|uniref:Hypoxia inducible factor 1 subunit alpha, like n=1 Tax=Austrofundulus limnaeus TaxID=52670 RepID=A0A2I4BUG6_AUSLI|nr:PREDICTED: hypoxia-inducible factor 3-alpha-like [Austrofundulus limnaeus]
MEKEIGTVAVKRSSSEQRKLRSRDAARCRRSQETEVFYELARTLPLPRKVCTHLDKAGIMRVALSFLRLQQLLRPEGGEEDEKDEDPMDAFYPEALAGFIMVMTEEGDMIFLTENVNKHIGITQLDLLGQSVYDFVHPCDQEELRDLLTPRPGLGKKFQAEQPSERNFFLRMKSTLTSRGRTVNIKSATWKVLHCTGHVRPLGGSASTPAAQVMTLLCEPIAHPSSVEFPLDTCTFLTRHSMDLRFTHCEGRVAELVGYKPDDLIGRSAYEFYHALDCERIRRSLQTLLSKGQVNTSHYRFLANSGGYVWAETQATILYNNKTSQPEAIVCLNFILSAVEQPDVVFSAEQTRCSCPAKTELLSPDHAPEDSGISTCESDGEHAAGFSEPEDLELGSPIKIFLKLEENPDELLQLAPDAAEPLAASPAELSFASPPSPSLVPEDPKDLCTPELRKLLSPIFDSISPSSSSCPEAALSPGKQEEVMDTSEVEKFFTFCPEVAQKKPETLQDMEEMDLEMLAPYISMDDDFQLTFLSALPEDADKPPSFSFESSDMASAVTASRKRTRDSDDQIQDKRQKPEPSSIEEELLLSQRLLDSLEGADQSDLILDPKPCSQLLTDRDPVLGGVQGLCDTAALMDMFAPRTANLSPLT